MQFLARFVAALASSSLVGAMLLTPLAIAQSEPSGVWLDSDTNCNSPNAVIPEAPEVEGGGNLPNCLESALDLYREGYLNASFNRYAPEHALCCASRSSVLFYAVEILNDAPVVVPQLPASTSPNS